MTDKDNKISLITPVTKRLRGGAQGITKANRGIYLLPNLLTTTALFSGFYSVLLSHNGSFEMAAIAIVVAVIFDGLDGRIARLTNTQSNFGIQYDSLSDVVCFGVAPALLVYSWQLHSLNKFGLAIAFIYTACTAMRLARFNQNIKEEDKRYFIGLASPIAATFIASMVWVNTDNNIEFNILLPIAASVTLIVSLLMVSRFKYISLKDINLKGRVSFFSIVKVVALFALIAIDPPIVLSLMSIIYCSSAPIAKLIAMIQKGRSKNKANHSVNPDN